jgi:hypothetical protein
MKRSCSSRPGHLWRAICRGAGNPAVRDIKRIERRSFAMIVGGPRSQKHQVLTPSQLTLLMPSRARGGPLAVDASAQQMREPAHEQARDAGLSPLLTDAARNSRHLWRRWRIDHNTVRSAYELPNGRRSSTRYVGSHRSYPRSRIAAAFIVCRGTAAISKRRMRMTSLPTHHEAAVRLLSAAAIRSRLGPQRS